MKKVSQFKDLVTCFADRQLPCHALHTHNPDGIGQLMQEVLFNDQITKTIRLLPYEVVESSTKLQHIIFFFYEVWPSKGTFLTLRFSAIVFQCGNWLCHFYK